MSNDEPVRRDAVQAARRTAVASESGGSGAGQGFQVNPEQYRAAVSPLLAAAEQVRALYAGLSAFLPPAEATNPWGNDDSGKKFAEGDEGYLKFSKDTLEVVKSLPDALKGIAEGMKAMAEGYDGAEEGIVSTLETLDATEIAIPAAPALQDAPVNNPVHIPATARTSQSGRH
ncbi:hypothetical protein ACIA8O_31110 [Kitasatospora sp. NPDC051853]|uniref:hypothetical protein n=1 Tax=Kitasatospora sp. NPDC051853 TaxID=3364058 RepID=UPI0037A7ECA0